MARQFQGWAAFRRAAGAGLCAVLCVAAVTAARLWAADHASVSAIPTTAPASSEIGLTPVFGEDTRGPVPGRYAPLAHSVGLLLLASGKPKRSCSAFCVAPDIVATAGHCLLAPDPVGNRPALTRFRFELGEGPSKLRARITGGSEAAAHWNVLAGTTRFPHHPPLTDARDWALIRLDEPICQNRVLRLGALPKAEMLAPVVLEKRIFSVSHGKLAGQDALVYSGDCETERDLARLILVWRLIDSMFLDAEDILPHRCDLAFSASGSPLFVETASGPVVAGINVGFVPVPRHLLRDASSDERRRALVQAIRTSTNIAASASAYSGQIGWMRGRPEPLTSEAVTGLQTLLGAAGYFAGSVDGVYGLSTRQAILDAERSLGLLVTGQPTQELLRILEERGKGVVLPDAITPLPTRPRAPGDGSKRGLSRCRGHGDAL